VKSALAVILVFLGTLVTSPGFAAEATQPPNIVVILADDLGWNDVSWNNPRVKTPNLERLCAEGVRLDQQYVLPMCTPTRAALLTGRYASRFGVTSAQRGRALPFETVTLARALHEAGYETALTGKWHLGSDPASGPQKFGFDHSHGVLGGAARPYTHGYQDLRSPKTWHRNGVPFDQEGHITDLIAQEAATWIGQRTGKPFFLCVAFTAPHAPIAEPDEWLELYASDRDWLRFPREHLPAKLLYYAAVSHMDAAVGRIVEALERSGKRNNTLILFLSDNGATPNQPNADWEFSGDPRERFTPGPAGGSNAPLRGQKTQVYEGGIRVPAFVHWAGRLKPGQYPGAIHVADWMPTFCALAGYRPATDLKWDGADIWPWLSGQRAPEPRRLYWAGTDFLMSAVRDGDWKLVHTRQTYRSELFDLSVDPNETTDLAAVYPERVAAMREMMRALAARDNESRVQ
jgi:arylsulfatase A-like enzyme